MRMRPGSNTCRCPNACVDLLGDGQAAHPRPGRPDEEEGRARVTPDDARAPVQARPRGAPTWKWHEDGSVTLGQQEAEELRDVLEWIMRVYQAVGFMAAECNYALILGLRGKLGEGE